MDDKFLKGFIAGTMAGIAKMLFNFFSFYILHFAKDKYLGFFSVIIHGKKPSSIWMSIFYQMSEIIFTGMLGILFIYIIPKITSKHLYFKGWLYGAATWFAIYALGTLFKIPTIYSPPWETIISHFISSSIYGLILAGLIKFWENRDNLI